MTKYQDDAAEQKRLEALIDMFELFQNDVERIREASILLAKKEANDRKDYSATALKDRFKAEAKDSIPMDQIITKMFNKQVAYIKEIHKLVTSEDFKTEKGVDKVITKITRANQDLIIDIDYMSSDRTALNEVEKLILDAVIKISRYWDDFKKAVTNVFKPEAKKAAKDDQIKRVLKKRQVKTLGATLFSTLQAKSKGLKETGEKLDKLVPKKKD